jgi:xylulose-5-phosphate/fructose-6-phosphate phosphoketolase
MPAVIRQAKGLPTDKEPPVTLGTDTRTSPPASPALRELADQVRSLDVGDLDSGGLDAVDAWWRAANYLTVGQIYLRENALLTEPLRPEHIKPRLLGHWGTSPGLSFLYAHLSRLIRLTGQQAVYLAGPGHGGPALVAAGWLEGTYSEVYPRISQDAAGMRRLFRQFSAPGGIPSHVSVTTPGSIHEGGELGYVLMHAFGAVMDNPDLLALAVVGDGEAETGPLEGAWKGISFLNPARDGAVLPVLHLNGAKISGPTVLGRKDPAEVRALLGGHGYDVIEVSGHELPIMHQRLATALGTAWESIRRIQVAARTGGWDGQRPRWPLIVLRTPKGWTGPEVVDGVQIQGTFRAHQVPLSGVRENPAHLAALETWLRSYRPEELFGPDGSPAELVRTANPRGDLRMSASPHANGGVLTKDLDLPDFRDYAVDVPAPATVRAESTRRLGELLRDLYRANPDTFRLFCPDETNSNRLGAVFEATDRAWAERVEPTDVALSRDGRVMEVLSEHNCHGWLEGYTACSRPTRRSRWSAPRRPCSTASGWRRRPRCPGARRSPASTCC